MPNMYYRSYHTNLFRFADMESRVRNFILDKTVSLLQSFRSKTLPMTFDDIESGFLNASQPPQTNVKLHYCPRCESCRKHSAELRSDDIRYPTSPSNGPIKQRANGQPQFTEGQAHFITANDGSIALLVTEELMANLRDLYEDSHHLSENQKSLDYMNREVRVLETSIDQPPGPIEVAESEENIAGLQEVVRKRKYRLLRSRQRRHELEDGAKKLERKVTSSKAHVLWVLHNAMKEADLLEPHRPLTPVTMTSVDSESRTHEKSHYPTNTWERDAVEEVSDRAKYAEQHSVHLAITDKGPEEWQLLRREAWRSYNEASMTVNKIQALFDDRQESYETDLADYRQGLAEGIYNISRSEFDRSKIRYGQKVTRALINAEEAFEAAKEQAQAVGAIGSDSDDAIDCYGYYEESWPASELASYLNTKDWSRVHGWLAKAPGDGEPREPKPETELELEQPEVDDWFADEIDPADSISQVDFDEWRRDIDRWENVRFDQWEDMRAQVGGPEVHVGFLVRSIESLKRRHSIPLCRATGGEWGTSI